MYTRTLQVIQVIQKTLGSYLCIPVYHNHSKWNYSQNSL